MLAIKGEGTGTEFSKTRFLESDHRDGGEYLTVRNNRATIQQSVQMLFGIGSIFRLRMFSTNNTQAYLQNVEARKPDIFKWPCE